MSLLLRILRRSVRIGLTFWIALAVALIGMPPGVPLFGMPSASADINDMMWPDCAAPPPPTPAPTIGPRDSSTILAAKKKTGKKTPIYTCTRSPGSITVYRDGVLWLTVKRQPSGGYGIIDPNGTNKVLFTLSP